MNIEECKKFKMLPKPGQMVLTILDDSLDLPSGKVINRYVENRLSAIGRFVEAAKESGGNYWYIENEINKTIGIYHYSEVFDV